MECLHYYSASQSAVVFKANFTVDEKCCHGYMVVARVLLLAVYVAVLTLVPMVMVCVCACSSTTQPA